MLTSLTHPKNHLQQTMLQVEIEIRNWKMMLRKAYHTDSGKKFIYVLSSTYLQSSNWP